MRGFGDLEAAIMEMMWRREQPATVRQIFEELAQDRAIAYTTVMTVMDNLHRKGFLDRQMTGRAWTYQPSTSREQYVARLMRDALAEAGDQQAALTHFVTTMSQDESTALRAALRRLRRKGAAR